MVTLNRFLTTLNRFLWGLPMILLLSAVHLFLTWKTGFIQKKLPLAIRLSLAPESGSEGDISPFGALSTALASTLGTGNIIGVGTAVALGGPGAVFWCWITGVFGIARGLFTNEAGMGSAPIAAAAARCSDPVRQALVASTATFWDTVVICLITGLVIVSSLLATDPSTLFSGAPLSGEALTLRAFTAIPVLGRPLLLFSIITFAYATILGWSYYGERCLEYMVRFRRGTEKQEFFLYRFFWILTLVFAPVLKLSLVFSLADTLNALMALPNLLALILLSDVIARDTHAFFRKEKL